jgi:hypothetical protein
MDISPVLGLELYLLTVKSLISDDWYSVT